ncbi:hypothetical protein LJC20_05645 [Eubacteriales bacterium OttesenSCG-928-M02]|nr:hypothetical protein [Eubacteriales bacterium OttesenSCG-928-M02]
MYKKVFPVLLLLLLVLVGCTKSVAIDTDLGAFTLARIKFVDSYAELSAEDGEYLLVVALNSDGFDETKFKAYFCAEDGSSVARIKVAGEERDCIAVGVQGNSGSERVEYTLIFPVKTNNEKASMELKAPNKDWIVLQ